MVLSFAGHHTTTFLYLYMIMILQLLFNMTLFLCTSYKIRKLQQETKKITKSGESRKFNRLEADKDRFANPYKWSTLDGRILNSLSPTYIQTIRLS